MNSGKDQTSKQWKRDAVRSMVEDEDVEAVLPHDDSIVKDKTPLRDSSQRADNLSPPQEEEEGKHECSLSMFYS